MIYNKISTLKRCWVVWGLVILGCGSGKNAATDTGSASDGERDLAPDAATADSGTGMDGGTTEQETAEDDSDTGTSEDTETGTSVSEEDTETETPSSSEDTETGTETSFEDTDTGTSTSGEDTETETSSSEDTETETETSFEDTDTGTSTATEDTETDAVVVVDPERFDIEAILASELSFEAPGTVGIVTWSVADVTVERAVIHFGLTDAYGLSAPVDLDTPDYRTLLLGMKSDRTYHFKIAVESDGTIFESGDKTLETGPPSNLISLTTSVENPESHEPGYILSTRLIKSGAGDRLTGSIVFILDPDGDIVWWYQSRVGQTSRAHLSYDKTALWLIPDRGAINSASIERVTLDTLESTIYDVGASHDAIPSGNGVLTFIEYGEGDCGSLYTLNVDGETEEIFESSELLPGMVPNDCHTNGVRYYESKGLYSVSDYQVDIFIIDTEGELQWRLTDVIPNETWGGIQHGHQLLDDSIVLFANHGGESGAAIIEYALPSGEEIFRYEPGLNCGYYGDVQRLPGGNTLATFSVAGIIHEVTPDGEPVMVVQGDTFGYAVWHASLYPE